MARPRTPEIASTGSATPPAATSTTDASSGESALWPYLSVLAVALVLAVVLAAYLWLYRAQIIAILTQMPT